MSNITISNPREYRLLKQLLKEPTSRKALNDIIGAANPPQNVSDIRHKHEGLEIIYTEYLEIRDRDGKKSRPGVYGLHPEVIPDVRRAVKEWEKSAATPSPTNRNK